MVEDRREFLRPFPTATVGLQEFASLTEARWSELCVVVGPIKDGIRYSRLSDEIVAVRDRYLPHQDS